MRDLTTGNTFRAVLGISFPIFLSVFFQQSGLAESFFAGRYFGEAALSAVGNASVLAAFFMLFSYGLNVGGSVVISHLYGGKDYALLVRAVSTLFISGAVFALAVTVLGTVFCRSALALINTPPEIVDMSENYLKIFLIGLIFMYIFNICSGISTALGDSVTPCILLIIFNILSIAFCFIAAKLELGVEGLAAAKVIAQFICTVPAVFFIHKKLGRFRIKLTRENMFSREILKKLFTNVIPATLHTSVGSVGNMFIQAAINPLGMSAIAGLTLGGRINGFASDCIDSIPDGTSAFAAQNIGAERFSRVKKGFRAGLIQVLCLSVLFSAVFIIFGGGIAKLFTDNGSLEAVHTAKQYICITALCFPLMGVKYLCDDILRAAGRMKLYLFTTVQNLVLRVLFVYIFTPFFGAAAVGFSFAAATAISAAVSIGIYRKQIWRRDFIKRKMKLTTPLKNGIISL
ncbi:MAG: polysaccharide biosynthesis C-terminal domain-containing protein [Ruminococcus sp.]|nr:polysaccharide biosynthesis C-terminal domain-containing protein [Ruminococcus sp.]